MQITQEAIDNVRKIELNGFDKEELQQIQTLHKELQQLYAIMGNSIFWSKHRFLINTRL